MEIHRQVKYEEELDKSFLEEIKAMSGAEDIDRCISCGTCSSSCPMSVYMDYPPRKIIALVKNGLKQEALRSFTIWLCSSCYSCQVRCPSKIEITEVMYALKRKAMAEKVYPEKLPIPVLDKEMSQLIKNYGRNSELWLILRLYLKSRNLMGLLKMAPLGLKLMKTGRMSFKREAIKNRQQIKSLLNAIKEAS